MSEMIGVNIGNIPHRKLEKRFLGIQRHPFPELESNKCSPDGKRIQGITSGPLDISEDNAGNRLTPEPKRSGVFS